MENDFGLEIGGVLIQLLSRDAITFTADSMHAVFQAVPGTRPAGGGIRLELKKGFPPAASEKRLFDSEETWSLSSTSKGFRIDYGLPDEDRSPHRVIVVDSSFSEGTIFCRPHAYEEKGGRVHLTSDPLSYPIDQILLMHYLSRHGGAIIHSAGISLQGRACIFPGRSGAGKSTLSRILAREKGITVSSDDRIIVRKTGDAFPAYGTPWPGDAGFALNESSPLSGIFFLHHGGENKTIPLSPQQAAERLIPVTSVPWYDQEAVSGIFSTMDELVSAVPAYDLFFRPDGKVVTFLEKILLP